MHSVTLIPSPPSEGWHSMDRYWRELATRADSFTQQDLRVDAFLPGPPLTTRAAGRAARAFQRYAEYPLRTICGSRAHVFHLLDHSHSDVMRFLPRASKAIVTVHDLAPLRDAGDLSLGQIERFRSRVSNLARADLILADSEFTADDVRGFLGTRCPELVCLPLGVDFDRYQVASGDELRRIERPDLKVLCVGSNHRRKNLQILPEVLGAVAANGWRIELVRVGPRLPEKIRGRLLATPDLRLTERPDLSEAELIMTYQRADLLFFPSTLEGFGFPVLEAMAAGTSVLAARASSVPEIGLETIDYFDPGDPADAAVGMIRLASAGGSDPLRRHAARERARELDWSNHVEKLAGWYRRLAA